MKPPIAKREPHTTTLHGDTRTDFYHWLRSDTPRENANIMAYLETENRYAEKILEPTKPLQDKLYQEMVGRLPEEDSSPPVFKNGWSYFTKTPPGEQYEIHYRCRETGEEETLLDLNELARDLSASYLELGFFKVSSDGNILAYSLDTTGSRSFSVYFKNLETKFLRIF
jgi:oligopeptidase B